MTNQFDGLIAETAARYGLSPFLVKAIVAAESNFDPRAYRAEPRVNDASYGLMQTLYATAKHLGYSGPPEGLFDPETSLEYGTRYLKYQLGRYREVPAAIAAYNAGTAYRRADGSFTNQAYVNRVLSFLQQFTPSSPTTTGGPSSPAVPNGGGSSSQTQIKLAMARSAEGDVGAGLQTFLPAEAVPVVVAGVVAIGLALLARGGSR